MTAGKPPVAVAASALVLGIFVLLQSCSLLAPRVPSDLTSSPLLQDPPVQDDLHIEGLRIATFNIQDMLLAADRSERRTRIARELVRLDVDVACIQEAFIPRGRAKMWKILEDGGFVDHRYFANDFLGTGMWIVSRYPIVDARFRGFSEEGGVYGFDFMAGKGIGLCRIAVDGCGKREGPGTVGPAGESTVHAEDCRPRIVDVFVTHLVSNYSGEGGPSYMEARRSQVAELGDFLWQASPSSIPSILAGDLNCSMGQPEYQELTLLVRGRNLLPFRTELDYILGATRGGWTYEVANAGRIPETLGPWGELSDHFGYWVEVSIRRQGP